MRIIKIFLSIGLFYLIILIPFNFISAASTENVNRVIDIMTTPEKVLFDITNFKPGDWATRTLTIKNGGTEDFNYVTSANRKSGSKDLYEQLLLTISDAKGEIFNGKLGEFKKIKARPITSSQQEDLTFTVEFPSHLGNEYQGLVTEVELKFYAEGTLGGVLPVDGPKLPETGTNSFNILIAGIVLVIGGGALLLFLRRRINSN